MMVVNVFGIETYEEPSRHYQKVTIFKKGIVIEIPPIHLCNNGCINKKTGKLLNELTKESCLDLEGQGVQISVGL